MRSILLLLSICIPFWMYGQSNVFPLWPEGIPCESQLKMEVEEDERIGRRISKVREPVIEVFLPPASNANGTGIVICPGGGYTILAWDWEGIKMAEWFNELGIAAFVLRYRLPHWEEEDCKDKVALMDAQRAMRLVRSKADEWNLDTEKIGIMGFSAGGHLASTVSTHFNDNSSPSSEEVDQFSARPDFSILIYPVITMDEDYTHMGSRKNLIGNRPSKERASFYSNEAKVTKQTPPALLIHANDDEGVVPENSVKYYLALREHGVPAAMHVFETGGHGFSFAEDNEATGFWPTICEAWLKVRGLL